MARQLLCLIAVALLLLLAIGRWEPGRTEFQPAAALAIFNLDAEVGLRAAVEAVGKELVLLTTNAGGLPSVVNMALQLRRVRVSSLLVLADRRRTCTTARGSLPWLRCGWSGGLGRFERYRDAASGSRDERLLWALWSAKWLTAARLVDLGVTILCLDSDAFVLANPFELLNAPPLSHYAMIVPTEGARVNIGFLYVRGGATAPGGGVSSVLWDVVRRLRLFTEEETLVEEAGPSMGRPKLLGLWDQGLFTDALASATRGEHVYYYTYSVAPSSTKLFG